MSHDSSKRREVIGYHDVAAIVGDDGDDLCRKKNRRREDHHQKEEDRESKKEIRFGGMVYSRSTSGSSAGPPDAMYALSRACRVRD